MENNVFKAAATVLLLLFCIDPCRSDEYPPEDRYDFTTYSDESVSNLRIRNCRWPDCYTLKTCINDIFRLEGVNNTEEATEAKAFALWKWFMTLMSPCGGRLFEGNPQGKWVKYTGDRTREQIELRRGDKQLLVYGIHQCGGVSRTMVQLWRAAGFLGYQEVSSGHTTPVLRYMDRDGLYRMHTFDPRLHLYYWDNIHKCVGVRAFPVLRLEYRAFMPPPSHSLQTSLRTGERVSRQWHNDGYIQHTERMMYFNGSFVDSEIYRAGVAGQEIQVLNADITASGFKRQLFEGSENIACSPENKKGALLHPAKSHTSSVYIYRVPSPYVAVDAVCRATLYKKSGSDMCRLFFSTDMGKMWHLFYEKKKTGLEKIEVELGRDRYFALEPSVTSNYDILIKAEFRTSDSPDQVGMNRLEINVYRQLNMRALPNLMPGENIFKISADRLTRGYALKLDMHYEVNSKPIQLTKYITKLPFYFRIDVNNIPKDKLLTKNCLKDWRTAIVSSRKYRFNHPSLPLRMHSIDMELVPVNSVKADRSGIKGEEYFRKPYKLDVQYNGKKARKHRIAYYHSQTSGFFPQLRHETGVPKDRGYHTWLVNQPTDKVEYYNFLAKQLGMGKHLPQIKDRNTDPVQLMIKLLPRAWSYKAVGICNVLSHFRDKRAIPVLLEKWEKAPKYKPGGRYIPDALAAIGDRSVVPALVRNMKNLTFDYRVHVARALGILGGREAEQALENIIREDPNISVRTEAKRRLRALREKGNR